MGTQTAPTPSFARFTRSGFGFTPRLRTDSKNKSRNANSDDEWYIPYNGPYELPKDTAPRRLKARDSWGDPVDGWEYDAELDDKELHLRYGGGMEEERKGRSRDRTFSVISARTTSSDAVDPSRTSMRTATMKRRSTISAGSPPLMPPSFVSLDAIRGGGVGESPIPPNHRPTRRRHSKDKDPNPNNRMSIASIFSFGGRSGSSRRESPASLSGRKPIIARLNTKQERERTDSGAGNKQRKLHDQVLLNRNRQTSIPTDDEAYYNSYYSTLLTPNEKLEADRAHRQVQERSSPITPTSGSSISPGGGGVVSRHNSASSNSGHPYAYVFPQLLTPIASAADVTHSAPITPANNAPRLTFTTTPSPSGGFSPRIGVNAGTTNSRLKGSTSTPNLRDSLVGSSHIIHTTAATTTEPQAVSTFAFPKGKDRWLSAETWCDALLFPRPRLKVKQQPPPEEETGSLQVTRPSTSGRIVSPPTTPLAGAEFGVLQRSGQREPGVASRVLAHSRSLVDLRNKTQRGVGKEKDGYEDLSVTSNGVAVVGDTRTTSTSRAPRPTSWAQDDLSLPAPVPSLAHVLREGEQLDLDRRAWKRQATQSFGNKHARSVSRTRSKSLTQKGRRNMGVSGGGHHHQSSMDYIAARAYLGSQGVAMTPTIVHIRPNTSSSDGYTTTTTTGTHSHSSSLAKTLSKSSKSHSRTHSHSRSDSWSKSAIKMAKATVVCVYPNTSTNAADRSSSIIGTGSFRGPPDLEGALRKDSTRVIRLADPAHLPVDRGVQPFTVGASSSLGHSNQPLLAPPTTNYAYTRKTPSPSGYESMISESKVGIALGTPEPGGDEDSDAEVEYLNYVPSHPYAQGGLSFSTGEHGQPGRQHGDFAGAHPSLVLPPSSVGVPPISEILARHKLSPHIAALHMVQHPYAQAQRDSYIDASGLVGQHRSEGTPHAAKMWAQLSPGVVREILADDLKYSPYLEDSDVHGAEARDDDDDDLDLRERGASNIHYTVGPAGGLVNPARFAELGDNPPPGFGGVKSRRRKGVHLVPSRSMDLGKSQQQQSFQHVLDTNQPHIVEYNPNTTQKRLEADEKEGFPKSSSDASSSNSSSPRSPPMLDSPHDLENFQDLFYRPDANSTQRTPDEAALPDTPSSPRRVPISPEGSNISWEKLRNRRTGSGLTSLARQLSNEFEQLSLERQTQRTSSLYSNSNSGSGSKFDYESHRRSHSATASLSSRHQSGLSGVFGGAGVGGLVRRPTLEGSSLHFVFEEVMPSSESPPNNHESMGLGMGLAAPIPAFNPSSDTLPEDVSASSFMENNEEEEEDPAMFRVGMVESSSTPPVVSSTHRNSFLGDVHDDNTDATTQHQEQEQSPTNENDKELEQEYYTQEHHTTYRRPRPEEIESPEPRTARVLSSLHPPTEATRSSYMTTSTTSRMSALSDFPVPPMSHHHQDNNDEDETARFALPEQRPQDLTTPRPMSLLSSYFNEAMGESESRVASRLGDIQDSPALRSAVALLEDHRLAFAVHQERGY